jgi:pimeloyl-ACP methyl ester carboxylesterase
MSTPHTQAYLWAFNNDEAQIAATGYIRKYQTPGFEDYFAANDYALLRGAWKGFPQSHIDDYLTIFSVPEARTATINWYRAIFLPKGPNNPEITLGDVTVPTLYIWGSQDPYLVRAGVEKSHTYMKGEYNFVSLNGGHWLMQFNEAEVSKEIIDHITKYTE